ncbi:MAG: UDP-N-acetylglucosamine 1-carboxyvinyltransferase, partial [Bacteroidia bacterium]|nr:UDP-N-acetylglucosamine 1-carboxyvinyltransferase [Bacteroidia bacterium]
MSSFIINGGKRLAGEITPQGAKNEALQVLCATLLTDQPLEIANLPDILDVNNLIDLLCSMGVEKQQVNDTTIRFHAHTINFDYLKSEAFRLKAGKIRGSIMLAGPLLGRYQQAFISKPGGDKIGRRRLDTHFLGLNKLGAEITFDPDLKMFSAKT